MEKALVYRQQQGAFRRLDLVLPVRRRQKSSFADRAQIGERLAELFVECGLAMTDCSPAMAPIASFMACDSAALSAPDRDVAVTVFLRLLDQPDDAVKKGFLHLANQSEQRLEFIVVDEDDARRAACIGLLGSDARIASVKSDRTALARGRYAIFADFNNECRGTPCAKPSMRSMKSGSTPMSW